MFAERTSQRPTTPKGGNVVNLMLSTDMTFGLSEWIGLTVAATPAHCAYVAA